MGDYRVMGVVETINIISDIIKCFNEGLGILFKFNEHYDSWKEKRLIKKENQISLYCNLIDIMTDQKVLRCKETAFNSVLLYMSDPLYDMEFCKNKLLKEYNLNVKHFKDEKELKQLSSVILEHPKDSIIVIRNNYRKKGLTLQFEMLNIVPGNDNLCYTMTCKSKCNLRNGDYKRIANELLESVIIEIMQTYQKYQQTVVKSMNRLELEARILTRMGYTDFIFKQIDMGYGLEIKLENRKLILGIPYDYPQKPPTVVLLCNGSYKEVKFGNNWETLFTIGHIVTAIEEGEKERC